MKPRARPEGLFYHFTRRNARPTADIGAARELRLLLIECSDQRGRYGQAITEAQVTRPAAVVPAQIPPDGGHPGGRAVRPPRLDLRAEVRRPPRARPLRRQ